jgi:carbonic anhydrase/acetyltransferase-like protein (isoleucine patch superfamily)
VINPAAFAYAEAVEIGDVHIGPAAYVGPVCVLRGDFSIYYKISAASAGAKQL